MTNSLLHVKLAIEQNHFNDNMKNLCGVNSNSPSSSNNNEGFENHPNNNMPIGTRNSDVLESDSNISNYDQPAINGLKYFIYNEFEILECANSTATTQQYL